MDENIYVDVHIEAKKNYTKLSNKNIMYRNAYITNDIFFLFLYHFVLISCNACRCMQLIAIVNTFTFFKFFAVVKL